MMAFEFAYPKALWLLILLVPTLAWYIFKQRTTVPTVLISTIQPMKKLQVPLKLVVSHFLFGLKLLAIALLIICLARPQSSNSWENQSIQGIDIVMALDISGSM